MKLKIFIILAGVVLLFTNCNDVLDRPSLTTAEDDAYWTNEDRVRLYANAFYTNFFVGYGLKYTTTYAPNANYTFNDDAVRMSTQTQFGRTVPTSKGSTSLDMMWQSEFTGPTWNFAWVRKANVMIDRITNLMPEILTDEQYNHWTGVGRFFRALEYARLVNVFGDVPYYDTEVQNTDKDGLYKDRTPRNEVMDAVYNDFEYALHNVRLNDGGQYVNRYVVAAMVSRWALFEASWQKYYYKNNERAKKFFDQAVAAAEMVMNSGKYGIVEDFRKLFGSTDLTNSKDCILYRKYDAAQNVTHSIASTCNMNDPTDVGPNLDLIKAFICTDGKDWQTSSLENADDFTLSNLIKTRDSRFEASFYTKPTPRAKSSYLYVTKFIPRSGLSYIESGGSPAAEFQSEKNVTGYPVLRYAEVLLNWIEAKAELATLGGAEVSQSDIDISINQSNHNIPKTEKRLIDQMDVMETYRDMIRNNIGYATFSAAEKGKVDDLVNLMVETLMLPDSENKTIRIAGEKKPVSIVKSVFLQLDMGHIQYVLESLSNTTSRITNMKSYLLTALYNAPLTINNYYQARVNHDFSADQA